MRVFLFQKKKILWWKKNIIFFQRDEIFIQKTNIFFLLSAQADRSVVCASAVWADKRSILRRENRSLVCANGRSAVLSESRSVVLSDFVQATNLLVCAGSRSLVL